jgi:phosphatidate cytidylyltransferase
MLAPAMSEFFKRLYTALILLVCFGGAYLHSTTLFVFFLSGVLFFILTTEWPHINTLPPVPWLLCTLIYPVLPMLTLIYLTVTFRATDFFLPLYPFVVAWSADTGGYFIGKLWGNHKMCPSISPGKSWEGFMGSLVFVGIVQMVVLRHIATFNKLNNIWAIILLTVAMTSIAFLGGLWLSVLKRRQGLKDAGSLLPGHGGLMDRFDAVMFVGMATAAMAMWLR